MVKHVVHIADVHIRTYKRHAEYREQFIKFFNEVKNIIKQKELSYDEVRIVIAGDLAHQKINISNEYITLTSWFLKECVKIAPTVLILGNHDLNETNKDRMDSLTPVVELLDEKNLKFYKESGCYQDDNIIWCVYSVFNELERPDIEKAREEYGEEKTYIGLFHAPVDGSKTDLGFQIHGASLSIFEGTDITMLGDIHLRTSFNHNGTPINYPSSLIQQNYGEPISNHGFLFWDIKEKTYTEHNLDNDYGFYQFEVNSIEDIDNESEKLINA